MTLLAVWRDTKRLRIASDSRLTLGGKGGYADTSVKIAPFTLRVHAPPSQQATWEESPSPLMVERRYGMAAAGDTAATAPVKETLRILLESVTAVPGLDPSMPEVAQMARHFLHAIWYRGQETLNIDITGRMLILGYCPGERRPRAFSLSTTRAADPPTIEVEEVAKGIGDVQFFGSGAAAARSLRAAYPEMPPLEIVRAVALDDDPAPHIRAVGGRVQYGDVDGMEFRVYPVVHYDFDEDNHRARRGIYLGGVELYEQGPPPGVPRPPIFPPPLPEGFALRVTAIDPFSADHLRIEQEQYDVQPGYLFEDRIE